MDTNFVSRFLRNSAVVTTSTVTSMLFHFLSITILARHLSKDDFGIYVFILLMANFLTKLCGLGLELTLVKFIADRDYQDRDAAVWPIVKLRALSVMIVCLLFCFTGRFALSFFNQDVNAFIISICVLTALISFRDLLYKFFEGLGIFRKYALIQISSAVVRVTAIGAFLLWIHLDLKMLITIEIAIILLALLAQLACGPLLRYRASGDASPAYQSILKFCTPIYLNNILTFIYENLSIFIISAVLNPVSLATYDVARKAPVAMLRVFHSFIIVYFPNASKLFSQGKVDEARHLMVRSLTVCLSGTLFISVIAFIFQKEIIELVFSAKYQAASMAFALLMLNFNLRIIANIFGYSIVSEGHSSVPAKVNALSCCIGLAANLMLVPQFGILGAVYALIMMSTSTMLLYFRFLCRLGISPVSANLFVHILLYLISVGGYCLIGQEILAVKSVTALIYLALSALIMRNNVIKPALKYMRAAIKLQRT
jgi:O-antigen/teichoic acid export membrane protein